MKKMSRSAKSRKVKAMFDKVHELGFTSILDAEAAGHKETLKTVWEETK